jgi:hypothetical protein
MNHYPVCRLSDQRTVLSSEARANDTLENDGLENDGLESDGLENDMAENDVLENNMTENDVLTGGAVSPFRSLGIASQPSHVPYVSAMGSAVAMELELSELGLCLLHQICAHIPERQ